jgi:hypothetical protein
MSDIAKQDIVIVTPVYGPTTQELERTNPVARATSLLAGIVNSGDMKWMAPLSAKRQKAEMASACSATAKACKRCASSAHISVSN